MMLFGFFLLLACHTVEGDAILGRDLAAADARFAAIPPEEKLGYSPAPGSHRTISAAELSRIAARFDITGEFRDVCFEYPARELASGEVLRALTAGLSIPDADIQLIDFSRYAAPKGEIVFPLQSLSRPSPLHPGDPVIWRGYVKYGSARKFIIWAKVRVQVSEDRVVAVQDLPVAQTVQPSQIRVDTFTGFPSLQPLARTVEQVAGHALRRAVKAGMPIGFDLLEGERGTAYEVSRGELVEVEVEAGLARLKFEARAESSGVTGETVVVRNAKSGKTFQARVLSKGKVIVTTGMVSE